MIEPRSLLAVAGVYHAYQALVGGRRARRLFIERNVRPVAGERVLDLGCGPGDILDFLPEVEYLGVDTDPAYVASAREHYGERGTFVETDATTFVPPDESGFDAVIAAGLIHHLDDDAARRLFAVAARAVRPGGRFVTLDGCFARGQHPVARFLLRKDRGEYVRTRTAYEALARSAFGHVVSTIEHRWFRVPYTVIVMTCRAAASPVPGSATEAA